jgi:cellulose synthase/poly-beta-1,6-N-acetylglucosamine synthase-like glycosyltransferase
MAPREMLVSAIIPAYHRSEKLRRAVRSLLAQDLPEGEYEIIVADSSRDDENARIVAELQAETQRSLRLFRKSPEGPGPSRNLGARESRGRYLAFMDSDCQASPQWLREGVAEFEEGVGIVQGRVVPESGVPYSIFNLSQSVEKESFLYEAANILYRREAFEQVGGFPADLSPTADRPMGGEDVDLAWRVKRAGWRSRFAPSAVVTHEVVRMPLWRWFIDKHVYICPRFVRQFPELRRFFYARYFFDRTQAWTLLAVLGIALAPLYWATLLLMAPYILFRTSEPSRTLRGPLRLLRAVLYAPRDLASLVLLVAGSIRFRALLL